MYVYVISASNNTVACCVKTFNSLAQNCFKLMFYVLVLTLSCNKEWNSSVTDVFVYAGYY